MSQTHLLFLFQMPRLQNNSDQLFQITEVLGLCVQFEKYHDRKVAIQGDAWNIQALRKLLHVLNPMKTPRGVRTVMMCTQLSIDCSQSSLVFKIKPSGKPAPKYKKKTIKRHYSLPRWSQSPFRILRLGVSWPPPTFSQFSKITSAPKFGTVSEEVS